MRGLRLACALGLSAALAGCASSGDADLYREVATNLVTLQQGTTSELRDMRGTGPFREYDVPPAEMVEVLEKAFERADGRGAPPYVHVYVSRRYGEVLAKEFEGARDTYADPFLSAAIAIVHEVREDEGRCRVETHHLRRGPFHGGSVAWGRDLPGWIEEALAARDARTLKPIP